ncbi:hypothetical protein Rsub_04713 [Raphidocelis subcapitata]|uniref:Uncharacterized protein n=1 Tax=Raphidocelis subcapitata TaxID=307507 RepID=A0A2V0NXB9_9CHLO|nr:hypothetical protein Rsub_04713 [Raphidocelis subcapitata]|eukprot:GBF91989.1 hypothetical protein Rsub_04713 [Raphidocelis subcapitata]
MRQLFAAAAGELGDGRTAFAWSPRGNYLAAAGNKRQILIYDRSGKAVQELPLPPPDVAPADPKQACCLQLQWDANGDTLAALPTGSNCVFVWTAATRELQKLETEFKAQEVTAIAWARGGGTLAAATAKGNLQLFQLQKRRRVPIVGKHTKRVLCGAWNAEGLLLLGAADKTVSLTDGDTGDTLKVWQLKGEPLELAAADPKGDGPGSGGGSSGGGQGGGWSALTNKRILYIFSRGGHAGSSGSGGAGANAAPQAPPLELSFQDKYGAPQRHLWFGNGLVMVGFRGGRVVVVSSASSEAGTELHSGQHLDLLSDIAHCPALARIAIGGGSSVKVLDVGSGVRELGGEAIEVPEGQLVDALGWSGDGQASVLTVSTSGGHLISYLAALPAVYASCGPRLAHLVSLRELAVADAASGGPAARLEVGCEPAFCAVGPAHIAVGLNNQVLYYGHSPSRAPALVSRREYLGTVAGLWLSSSHAAALVDGRLIVHPIEPVGRGAEHEHDAALPPAGSGQVVTCAGMTEQFVAVGTAQGALLHYLLPGLEPVNEYRHPGGAIARLWPQPDGVRCVFADASGAALLFSALNDAAAPLPGIEGAPDSVLWDAADPNVFVARDGGALLAYMALPPPLAPPGPQLLCRAALPATHAPLVLLNGVVTCRVRNGALDSITLESHTALQGGLPEAAAGAGVKGSLSKRFSQALRLQRLDDAWRCALALRAADAWRQLAVAALEALDVGMAAAAYRQLGDAGMVLSLESLAGAEDAALLTGHALVLLGRDPEAAQAAFLRSCRPLAALEMRRDLKQWPAALALARRLAPEEVPAIGRAHAAALELALDAPPGGASATDQAEHRRTCLGGLARTLLKLGDVQAGKAAALEVEDPALWKACAQILESAGHPPEAAELFERCGLFEKAAAIHIASKNLAAAAPLMARVASPKLQLAFARAKEAQGRWQEAAVAYEAGGDVSSAVRLLLEKLDAPSRAAAIVRKAGPGAAPDAAAAVARHCLAARDARAAAFDVAASRGEMDAFAALVGAGASAKSEAGPRVEKIAAYYEARGQPERAADAWARAEQRERAARLYLQVGTTAAISKAIALVEASGGDAQLAAAILDHLNTAPAGEQARPAAGGAASAEGAGADSGGGGGGAAAAGEVGVEELRFRLHMALGRLPEAARSALEDARREQDAGNYRAAHAKLLRAVRQIAALGARPPQELVSALALIHSYVIVRGLVARDDHATAARMLVRVAQSISRFPRHAVPILTSAVIECSRAGLKGAAFEPFVDERYRKKIELLVRKPDRAGEPEAALAPCPYCGLPGPEAELRCGGCESIIPFDIASGKRMTLEDWAECPACRFPCGAAAMRAALSAEGACPLCGERVAADAVARLVVTEARARAAAAVAGAVGPGAAAAMAAAVAEAGGGASGVDGGGSGGAAGAF